MRAILTSAALGLWLATATAGAAETSGPVQLAESVDAAQQKALDQIYAEAAAAGQGKSLAERQALYREAMPAIIEALRPGTRSASYAKAIEDSPAIREAQKRLAGALRFTNGDVPFYP